MSNNEAHNATINVMEAHAKAVEELAELRSTCERYRTALMTSFLKLTEKPSAHHDVMKDIWNALYPNIKMQ